LFHAIQGKQTLHLSFAAQYPIDLYRWVSTPGVDSAFGDKKKYLEPMRNLDEGTDGIKWLATVEGQQLKNGCFYLDREPVRTHIGEARHRQVFIINICVFSASGGLFMSEGSRTKNTRVQVDFMMKRLRQYATMDAAEIQKVKQKEEKLQKQSKVASKKNLEALSTHVDLQRFTSKKSVS